jgi:hypothetical protein
MGDLISCFGCNCGTTEIPGGDYQSYSDVEIKYRIRKSFIIAVITIDSSHFGNPGVRTADKTTPSGSAILGTWESSADISGCGTSLSFLLHSPFTFAAHSALPHIQ